MVIGQHEQAHGIEGERDTPRHLHQVSGQDKKTDKVVDQKNHPRAHEEEEVTERMLPFDHQHGLRCGGRTRRHRNPGDCAQQDESQHGHPANDDLDRSVAIQRARGLHHRQGEGDPVDQREHRPNRKPVRVTQQPQVKRQERRDREKHPGRADGRVRLFRGQHHDRPKHCCGEPDQICGLAAL